MASLFDISARIRLNTNDYSRQLQNAEKKTLNFAKKSEREFKKIGKTFKNLGQDLLLISAGPAYALARTVTNFRTAADEIGKYRKELGLTTEALSEYQFVAELSGLSFENFIESLRRQQDTLVSGRGDDVLAKLGLDSKELTKLSGDKSFETIIDAISKVGSEAERTSYAIDIWGKSGARMLRLSDDGAVGIAKMRAEARALGVSLSQDTVTSMEEFSDELTRVKFSATSLGRDITTALLPSIKTIVEFVKQATSGVIAWSREHPKLFKAVVLLGGGLVTLTTIVGIATIAIGQLAFSISSIARITPLALSGIKKLGGGLKTLQASVLPVIAVTAILGVIFSKNFRQMLREVTWLNKAVSGLQIVVTNVWNEVETFVSNGVDRLFTWIRQGLKTLQLAVGETALFAVEVLNFGGLLDNQASNLRNFTNQIRDERKQLEDAYQDRAQSRRESRDRDIQSLYDASIYGQEDRQEGVYAPKDELVDTNKEQLEQTKQTNKLLADIVRQQNGIGSNKVPVGAY